MAKVVKKHRSYLIKETNSRDNTDYPYWITTMDNELEWECDSLKEAVEWLSDL